MMFRSTSSKRDIDVPPIFSTVIMGGSGVLGVEQDATQCPKTPLRARAPRAHGPAAGARAGGRRQVLAGWAGGGRARGGPPLAGQTAGPGASRRGGGLHLGPLGGVEDAVVVVVVPLEHPRPHAREERLVVAPLRRLLLARSSPESPDAASSSAITSRRLRMSRSRSVSVPTARCRRRTWTARPKSCIICVLRG